MVGHRGSVQQGQILEQIQRCELHWQNTTAYTLLPKKKTYESRLPSLCVNARSCVCLSVRKRARTPPFMHSASSWAFASRHNPPCRKSAGWNPGLEPVRLPDKQPAAAQGGKFSCSTFSLAEQFPPWIAWVTSVVLTSRYVRISFQFTIKHWPHGRSTISSELNLKSWGKYWSLSQLIYISGNIKHSLRVMFVCFLNLRCTCSRKSLGSLQI